MKTQFFGKRSKRGAAGVLAGAAAVWLTAVLMGGCGNNDSGPVTPNVGGSYKLTVIFEPDSNAGYITPAQAQGTMYQSGTDVTVTAHPSVPGKYVFLGWTGADSTKDDSVAMVKMNGPKTLTAKFLEKFAVDVVADPDSGGTVERYPDSTYYTYSAPGLPVELTAIPNEGFVFDKWVSEDTTYLEADPIVRVKNKDSKYTAKFNPLPKVVATATEGGDSVTIEPYKVGYNRGDSVTVTVIFDATKYLFQGWFAPGASSFESRDNPYTFEIGASDKVLEARFRSVPAKRRL